MNLNGILQYKSDKKKILLFLIITFVSTILGILLAEGITALFFSGEIGDSLSDTTNVFGLKIKILITSVFVFIVPALFFAKLVNINPLKYLEFNHKFNRQMILLVVVIMLFSSPFIGFLSQINEAIIFALPDYFNSVVSWMKSAEMDAKKMTFSFLKMESITDLFFNLFLIAVIPALGEELFFRGVLQKLFIKWTSKPHLSILITAFLFSAIHMQFFGFLPRFVLGILLGYFYYFSKSIWMPILAHFFNNAMAVIIMYPSIKQSIKVDVLSDNVEVSLLQSFISLFAVGILFYLFYKSVEIKKEIF
jgi:uncharacterized protein